VAFQSTRFMWRQQLSRQYTRAEPGAENADAGGINLIPAELQVESVSQIRLFSAQ
jgi:hypothetical protein